MTAARLSTFDKHSQKYGLELPPLLVDCYEYILKLTDSVQWPSRRDPRQPRVLMVTMVIMVMPFGIKSLSGGYHPMPISAICCFRLEFGVLWNGSMVDLDILCCVLHEDIHTE